MMKPGVYSATKKDGTSYFRSSITFLNKHISLGSFSTEEEAHRAYKEARRIVSSKKYTLSSYRKSHHLSFQKWVVLINFRDNGIYTKTPIYLVKNYFKYIFGPHDYYLFDVDDLFFYSTHTISRRGGHLFVADYGMQTSILSRYGIKSYAVAGRDFTFVNNDARDFRYSNLEIHTRYQGVQKKLRNGAYEYEAKIHLNGSLLIGRYPDEITAAVAYNKAAATLIRKGYDKSFPVNYVEELTEQEYKKMFKEAEIRKELKEYPQNTK